MAVWKKHGRLFAIGDIHGCPDELTTLLKSIELDKRDTLVFVGDYVDRGPSAKDVIDILLEVKRNHSNSIFLKGNHEDMMLSFLGLPGHYGESFLYNGGVATLQSYAIDELMLDESNGPPAHRACRFSAKPRNQLSAPPLLCSCTPGFVRRSRWRTRTRRTCCGSARSSSPFPMTSDTR